VDITDIIGEDDMEDGENDEDDEVDPQNLAIPLETQRKPTKREKLDEKRKIEEYLDEHLPFDVRSHASTPPDSRNQKTNSTTGRSLQTHSG
jgi:hypothetical protein